MGGKTEWHTQHGWHGQAKRGHDVASGNFMPALALGHATPKEMHPYGTFCCLGIASLSALLTAGCAASAPTAHLYPLAIEYDLGALDTIATGTDEAILSADFREIARMGFNTVYATGSGDQVRAAASEAAARAGLRLLPSPRTSMTDSPVGETPATQPVDSTLLCLSAAVFESLPGNESYASWLAAYHAGLCAGRTGGVRVIAYRLSAEPERALVDGREPPPPAVVATLKRLLLRAADWGPRLDGLVPREVDALLPDEDAPRVVRFDGARRYLLLANPQVDRFVHTHLTLPSESLGRPVERAVRIVRHESTSSPEVVPSRRGQLEFDIRLPPGDAMLYELF